MYRENIKMRCWKKLFINLLLHGVGTAYAITAESATTRHSVSSSLFGVSWKCQANPDRSPPNPFDGVETSPFLWFYRRDTDVAKAQYTINRSHYIARRKWWMRLEFGFASSREDFTLQFTPPSKVAPVLRTDQISTKRSRGSSLLCYRRQHYNR